MNRVARSSFVFGGLAAIAASSRIARADTATPTASPTAERSADVFVDANTLCARAIAYLKRIEPSDPLATPGPDGFIPVTRAYGFGLSIAYLSDVGDRYEYVQHRHLAKAGINEDTLHASGIANLSSLVSGKLNIKHLDVVYAIRTGTEFDASALLLDELWDKTLAPYTPYGAAIVIPNQNTSVFCDRSLEAGLMELRQLSNLITKKNGDHLLIPDILLRHHGRWEILQGY